MEDRICNDKYYITDFKPTKYSEGIDEPASYKKHSNTAIESPSIAKRPEHYQVFEKRPRYSKSPSPVPSAVPIPQFRLPADRSEAPRSPTTNYSRYSRFSKDSKASGEAQIRPGNHSGAVKDKAMIRSLMKELDEERERRMKAEYERDFLKKSSPRKA